MNIKIPIHKRNLNVRIKALKNWEISEQDKKDLIKFLNDLELGKVNKGKKISESRRLKYLDILKTPLTFFNKPTSKLILKDVERFDKALSTGKIKSYKGKAYSNASQVDMKVALRVYLKWKLGDKSIKLTDWFDTRIPKKTPDKLSEQEVIKLFKACKTNEERYLIAVLFDSGCRAEEFYNIRKEDIQLPKGTESYVKLTLKEEYSKTKGRVISLYWKNSLESVRDYLNDRIKEGIKSDEQVFKKDYDLVRQFLNRFGERVLERSIYFHLFRKSSATYYASKLNRHQICYRYGWVFSSTMPDIYINRAGMKDKELDEKFSSTELEDIKIELETEKQNKSLEIEKLKEQNKKFVNFLRWEKEASERAINEIREAIRLMKGGSEVMLVKAQ